MGPRSVLANAIRGPGNEFLLRSEDYLRHVPAPPALFGWGLLRQASIRCCVGRSAKRLAGINDAVDFEPMGDQELCVVLSGPKTFEQINVLTVAPMRLDVHHGAEPIAVATAPVRAAGS